MLSIRSRVILLLIVLLLSACGPEMVEPTETPPTEVLVIELLVIDNETLDPDAIYTFENPGGWMVYQGHLITEDRLVEINALPSPESEGSFEEYLGTWTGEALEITTTGDGITYAVGPIADTISVLVETPDGVRWGIQMSLTDTAPSGTDLEAYTDDLMAIALSATYLPRGVEAGGD